MVGEWKGGIAPVPSDARTLRGIDFAAIWAGANIAVPMWLYGSFMADAGFTSAIIATVLGAIIGSLILASVGRIGADYGIPTLVSSRPSFGIRGSYIPSVVNVIQLSFWTGMMIWINTTAVQTACELGNLPFNYVGVTLLGGALCIGIAMGGAIAWKWFARIAVSGLVVLAAIATWVGLHQYSLSEIMAALPYKGLPFPVALDMAIAMPLSWVPCVCDYTRFAKSTKGAFRGILSGHIPSMIWFYVVGMILVAVTSEYSPVASMVLMGLGIPALFIIWLSTITTAFLDIYSGAVSLLNVFGKLKQWVAILIVGGIGIGLAFLPWLQVAERFLLILGSLFVPMFAIVLVHYFILARRRFIVEDIYKSKEGAYWYKSGFDIWTIAIWLIGFALYQLIANQLPVIGASLVTFIATALLYWAVERNLRR